MSQKTAPLIKNIATNRRARYEYEILETFECGIELVGAEVKSLRSGGKLDIADAYGRIDAGEIWLMASRIAPYEYATGFGGFDPIRKRKLLMHRREIDELNGKITLQRLTLVPLSLYFKGGIVKASIALAKGKKLHDKRRTIADRDANREAAREVRESRRIDRT
ncbi:MAG: SsrA-binding protein SmpB [Acidimicrobiales bacterium]|nr:SsrA-binding protein SmpB [Acidimicrobiales bacterium]